MEFETKKILLIEGNNDVAQTIRKYLVEASDQMFVVECENCLSEGLIHINRGDIDAILLDLYLPDSQGINTFTKIHSEVPEVPVIVLTDFDKDGMAHEVVRNGAQDYLLKKNIDGNMLARSVVYAIERHQKLVKFQLNESKIQNRLTLFCKSLNPFSKFQKKEERDTIPSVERFRELIEMERSRSDRYHQHFSLVIFDTKSDNKDSFLREKIVDLLLERRLRPSDEIGWFDKQNIGILLHNTETDGAWRFSRIICDLISAKHHPPDCSVYTYPSEKLDAVGGISLRRNEQRHDLEVTSSVYLDHEHEDNKIADLTSINISRNGAFFESDLNLKIGTDICINMVFPLNELKKIEGETVLVKAAGKIIRVEGKGMAVRFNDRYNIEPFNERKLER